MEKLRKVFLNDSIARIKTYSEKIGNEKLAIETERELFRLLHTIKGTAQTFGLVSAAKTAHQLEEFLHGLRQERIENNQAAALFLQKGLQVLIAVLKNKNQAEAEKFFSEFKNRYPQISNAGTSFVNLEKYISAENIKQLSFQEKSVLISAIEKGAKFFLLETDFNTVDVTAEFPHLRKILDAEGEVIATFPRPNLRDKIGFGHFFVSYKKRAEIVEKLKDFNTKITEQGRMNFTNDLRGVFAQAVTVAEQTAKLLDKKICIETISDKDELSDKYLKIFPDILLHLIRNAIAHGIECEGKITIEISSDKSATVLHFADNGRGIETENLRRKAIEKNLISRDKILSEEDVLNLIFAYAFSTDEAVSEISGRGVGLDAVKDTVEKNGGKISVKSEYGKGTSFKIIFPNNS